MKILTRGDLDGLSSCVLLTEVEEVREILFAHPKDCQDGLVQVDAETIVVNLPFIEGCALWFDHHVSEAPGAAPERPGRFEIAPSCARVIAGHYQDRAGELLERFGELLLETDRVDSAELTIDDVLKPQGWVLLGLTLDPRTGLGPEFQKYFRWLVEYVKEVPLEKILTHPEVRKRSERVLCEQDEHLALLRKHTRLESGVIVTDFRGVQNRPAGNRFLVFTLFPDSNVEVRLIDGHAGKTVAAVGVNIFNRPCPINVGATLRPMGGGGHAGAGTVQLAPGEAEALIAGLIEQLKTGG